MALSDIYFNPIFPVIAVAAIFGALFILFVVSLIVHSNSVKDVIFSALRVFLILACVFIINLRPMYPSGEADVETRNLDVLFVVDTTISMWAKDYDGKNERMDAVLSDTAFIMERLSGANFGLIRFDNNAQILAPFTQDARNVTDAFDTIEAPDSYYATGSDLSAPIIKMRDLLESSSKKEDRRTIVFFISDGEITNNAMLISYETLAGYIDNGAVLGYGTSSGGEMSIDYGSYVTDPETGDRAVSKIDEENLRQIASDLGIDYIHMQEQTDVEPKLSYILQLAREGVGQAKIETFKDMYYIACVPLAILLFIELLRVVYVKRL